MKKILLSSFVAIVILIFLTGCGDDKQVSEKKTSAVETKVEVEKVSRPVVKAKAVEVSLSEKGKDLYLKCAGCHGASAEMVALGKS